MRAGILAFVSGVLFAIGLGVGGMTDPANVIAFLDVAGAWDPSLALVMAGAVVVYAGAYRLALGRSAPLFGSAFALPTRTLIDAPLMGGAALFGIGWGLSGYCPGPALTSLPGGGSGAAVFVVTMLAGMAGASWAQGRVHRRRPTLVLPTMGRPSTGLSREGG